MSREAVINVSVVTTSPDAVARTAEVFARAATGLALDDIDVNMSITWVEDTTPTD